MTTKLAYQIRSVINYDQLSFNPDVPEPLPDAMYQYPVLQEVLHVLDTHLSSLYPAEEVFRSSNTFICYDPADLNLRVGPDFYAAFGVDAPAIERRKLYLPWEVGKPPDFALEVGSESTRRQDSTVKRQLYAQIGISEYWRFDRTGGDFYGLPLAGDQLQSGVYQPVALTSEPDGVLKGYSPALRLSLCWRNGMLKFYHHESGQYLRNLGEAETDRQRAEAGWQRAEADRQRERAARQRAEARLRELEAEMRRRPGEN